MVPEIELGKKEKTAKTTRFDFFGTNVLLSIKIRAEKNAIKMWVRKNFKEPEKKIIHLFGTIIKNI